MGKPKKRWTPEEEAALLAGVNKYGTGKWKDILTDQDFAHSLINRSNVDLKDKWRNLSGSAAPPQTLQHKHKCSWTIQIWRMVTATGLKRLCQIIIITAIFTMLLSRGLQTHSTHLSRMLTIAQYSLRLEFYYVMARELLKMWKDLKRFFNRMWRIYKWLESLNELVKFHLMV